MPEHLDPYGLPLSTRSTEAAAHYSEGLRRLLTFDADADTEFERAAALDAEFALAHAGLAVARWQQGRGMQAHVAARHAFALAGTGTRREQDHIAIVLATAGGHGYLDAPGYVIAGASTLEGGGYGGAVGGFQAPNPTAVRMSRAHLAQYPRDALVLLILIMLTIFSGEPTARQELQAELDRLAADYGDDAWFESWHGFCYQQLRQLDRARHLIDEAYARNPRNPLAAHGRSHLAYTLGDHAEGAAFLREWLPAYDRRATYHSHVTWHYTMLELMSGQTDRALEVYTREIDPAVVVDPVRTTLADSVEFLWRCQLYEPNRELPWEHARDYVAGIVRQPGIPLHDALAGAVFAGARDEAAIESLLASLRTLDAHGYPLAGTLVLPLVLGMTAFVQGEYEEAIRQLRPVVDETYRMGGSREQADMFDETLIEAQLRAGRTGDAVARITSRLQPRGPAHAAFWMARVQARTAAAGGGRTGA